MSIQEKNGLDRQKLYKKMDSLALNFRPVIPLYYDEVLWMTSKRIRNLTADPMKILKLEQVIKDEN